LNPLEVTRESASFRLRFLAEVRWRADSAADQIAWTSDSDVCDSPLSALPAADPRGRSTLMVRWPALCSGTRTPTRLSSRAARRGSCWQSTRPSGQHLFQCRGIASTGPARLSLSGAGRLGRGVAAGRALRLFLGRRHTAAARDQQTAIKTGQDRPGLSARMSQRDARAAKKAKALSQPVHEIILDSDRETYPFDEAWSRRRLFLRAMIARSRSNASVNVSVPTFYPNKTCCISTKIASAGPGRRSRG